MTVRSVLLNRDSPDIESRLKRRRNRTHQVRFKDLEDGSSSSGNSATGENNTRQRPAKDRDSPHPLRKHSSMSTQPWTDRPHTEGLLGQTSVVGAVRGDMASTIEKVAAFLARAPPHPLTPGPTRRCWAPTQANSLTLPMTRRPSTSTSTAIQTSPCLKKPQSLSSTHARSHSIGDSVGVDGDDEHDSQDEYLSHNHVLPGSKDQSRPLSSGDKTVVERRSKVAPVHLTLIKHHLLTPLLYKQYRIDKRGIRLPPPPPPPPPYTPRKKGSEPAGATARTPMLRTESKASEKGMEREETKKDTKDMKCTDSPKLCGRASSLKHRAQTPPVPVMKGERRSSTSSPAKACFKPSCLSSAQAQLGVLHKMLCSGASVRPNTPNSQHSLPPNQQGCSGARGCSTSGEQPATGPLSPTQADTLRQVQEILGGLMSGARCKLDPSRVTEKLLSPNGPLHDIRSLQNQLHSLEGVLETSQNTIKVLLDVIQDLEKKEAERDG
ncbi:hypothetical protein GOODEAATRI_007828 [Goodea atripinnis]|uniref:Uncharacterized protein n=1 Tax=Goodea atripinnis TaxID=208336 RepID=A0ABV0N8U3_9TELE